MQYSFFFLLATFCLGHTSLTAAFILTDMPQTTGLFDGESTTHWKLNYEDGWTVEDGSLTPTGKHRKNNYIWTKKSYDDFILTLQYRLSEGANSGVFIRTDPGDPVQGGIEIQLLDGPSRHAKNGELDKHSNGAIYDAVVPSEYNNRSPGEWNALLVYARGPTIAVYVNGNLVASANLDQWTRAGFNPDGSAHKFKKALSTLPQVGKIGLQYHGDPVWFRGIVVTELDENSPDLTQRSPRPPKNDEDLRYWLKNMIEYHGFNDQEVANATGLTLQAVAKARQRFDVHPMPPRSLEQGSALLTIPYPGGRHPRVGFLDGAIDPQRETKLSVFLPWEPESYVVVDAPEAIVSNLGLTYLAHIHFPSIWTAIGVELEPMEWQRNPDGSYELTRTFPNDISYTANAVPASEAVYFKISLSNGTSRTLTDMRLQNCVMLRGAPEFADLTKENKVLTNPYVAVHNPEKTRWIITAWELCHNPWANPNCPCMHSDPRLPDCPPGETVSVTGFLSFYEGRNIEKEFTRLETTGWRHFFD